MKRMTSARPLLAAAALAAALALAVAAAPAQGAATVLYSNMPSPFPGNTPSEAFEATQTSQFGGQVELAGSNKGFKRTFVTVALSSWGCETGTWSNNNCHTARGARFEWPVTLHIYDVGSLNAVGTELVKVTKTFKIPYRPSASAKCTGANAGKWFRMGTCFNGKLFRIVFNLGATLLPGKMIISVSYNTSDYGVPQRPQPCNSTEAGCPYDSLNVGLTEPTKFNAKEEPEPVPPSVGSDPAPEDAYQNSVTAEQYCDKGLQGTGTFRLDSGPPPCWTGYQPLFTVSAS